MNLEQFAKAAGVTIIECDPEWGGRIGYKEKDHPNSSVCGFRTTHAAYMSWLNGTFGEHASKAVLKLLKPYDGLKGALMDKKKIGPKKAALVDEFMTITRGIPLPALKKVLSSWVGPLAFFNEKSKTDLAMRYAKGRLSIGGEIESQRMRKLTPDVLSEILRAATHGGAAKQRK